MIKKILHFFDKLEDKVRGWFSHYPIVYALIGGVGVVLFWRGVWHMADDINMSSITSTIIGAIILLLTGVFVSAFIGSQLIITGLKGEKKLTEKTEEEVKTESGELRRVESKLSKIEKEIVEIEEYLENEHKK